MTKQPLIPNKQKFKTPYNSSEFKDKTEKNFEPSQTIPDQAMTVKQIMTRYAQGLPLSGERVPIYEGTDDDMEHLPDVSKLDLAEREQIIASYRQEVIDITNANAVRVADEKAKKAINDAEKQKQALKEAEKSTNIP